MSLRSRVGYNVFLQNVLPYVPDCPEAVAMAAVRDACIEFCEKSHYLREVLERDDVEAGEAEYDLACTVGYSVVMALSAVYKQRRLNLATVDQLTARYGSDWRNYQGAPSCFVQTRPGSIIFFPTPDESVVEGWYAEVALKPTRDSTSVDGRLFEHFGELIGFGARARIHDIPNQSFSDPQSALKFRTWFEAGCNRARATTHKGMGRAELRVRPRTFGV